MARLRPAFTLIELLVVISIIAVLLALLLPVLRSARNVAGDVRSRAYVRQLAQGFTQYTLDHHGHVPWGYPPLHVDGRPVVARAASGHVLQGFPAQRYPWRLVPYVGNVWEIIHSHKQVAPEAPEAGDSDAAAYLKAYHLSLDPAYGMNSIYIGGHQGIFRGFVGGTLDGVPNRGRHVVFHEEEVKRPSGLIVFGESQATGAGAEAGSGLYLLTPPVARRRHWRGEGAVCEVTNPGQLMGLPRGRHLPAAPVAFFDGHVEGSEAEALDDMRLWSNEARGPADDPVP